jgi:NTE family protein
MKKDIKIGIALGGGAVKGFAHIGVLQVLEKYGITPSFVAGTSMGSLIGGLYASGVTTGEMEEESSNLKVNQIADIKVFSMFIRGIFGGKKLSSLIEKYSKSAMIEDFKIPYRAVSVDLISGKQHIFKKGKISDAVRCSCSVPGFFEPFPMGKKMLVDGGLVNNVPYDVVKSMGADFVIAVDVVGDYSVQVPSRSVVNILINSCNLMICENEKNRPKDYNFLIKLNMPDVHVENFKTDNIKQAIENGRVQTEKQMPALLEALKKFKIK